MNVPTPIKTNFPHGTGGKESDCQFRRHKKCGSIPGSGRLSGEGNGNPLQYSCLENPMDRVAWWATELNMTEVTECMQHAEKLTVPYPGASLAF